MLDRWPNGVPPVAWYDMGTEFGTDPLGPGIINMLISTFYPSSRSVRHLVDIETRPSLILSGHLLLRITSPEAVIFFLQIDTHRYPLYQAGGETEALTSRNDALNFSLLLPETEEDSVETLVQSNASQLPRSRVLPTLALDTDD